MSLENVKRFTESVSLDAALQKAFEGVRDPAELVRRAVQLGTERGLSFTAEEFVAAVGTPHATGGPGKLDGELDDDQLAAVAGGGGTTPESAAKVSSLLAKFMKDLNTSTSDNFISSLTPHQIAPVIKPPA